MDYPGKVITKNQVTPTQTSATGVWTLDDAAAATRNNNWPVAGVPNPISKSLRFNSADSAYLNRTFSTPTSQNIWSFSCWLKRSSLADQQFIFWAGTSATNDCALYFTSSDQIGWFTNNGVSVNSTSTAVFRDPSAWYHIVAIANSTTMNVYVNNQQIITNAGMTNNTINSAIAHCIGQDVQTSGNEFSGYMTEINFIDGQALTPSSFGMTDPVTGVWEPLKYSGTYGTNGFYLNFKDATSTTTLGLDYSGNSNTWTTNNFSVTAGAGNDSLTDVPTPWIVYNTTGDVGGVVRGNYATLNPVASITTPPTFANGNLEVTGPSSGVGATQSTFGGTGGKFYVEVTVTRTSDRLDLGIAGSLTASTFMTSTNYLGTDTNTIGYGTSTGVIRKDNANNQTGLATCTTGDVVGMAIDMDSGTIQFYKNNSTVGTAVSFTPSAYGSFLVAQTTSFNTSKGTYNFGQRPFAYTPPSGFLSLCTTNLPASTILKGGDYFNANLYTGTGSAFTLTGVGFQPDFGWFKGRNASSSHWLHDVVRGANPGLSSNSTAAEDTTAGQLTAFASDGYSLPNDTAGYLNFSGRTMVVWSWKANGAGVTNTAGSITSTVSANTTSGFSIVTYTGTGVNATVGHGLGAVPGMIIAKRRSATQNWGVAHSSLTGTQTLYLDLTQAVATGVWNGTPTSTVFNITTDGVVNTNGSTYVAYCFAPISGFSAFGSYTGNGSTDGPFVYTGFRPRYVMIKNITTGGAGYDWFIHDTARDTYNVCTLDLEANLALSENQYGAEQDIVSNGFKLRNSGAGTNGSSNTYIYAAFAENPFKNALAR